MDHNTVTGQFHFRCLKLVEEYVSAIRLRLQLDGGI